MSEHKLPEKECESEQPEKPSLVGVWLIVLLAAFTYTAFSTGYAQATHNTGMIVQNIILGFILAACVGAELRNRIDMIIEFTTRKSYHRMASDLMSSLQKAFDAVDKRQEAAAKPRRTRRAKAEKPAEMPETNKKARKIPVKVVE